MWQEGSQITAAPNGRLVSEIERERSEKEKGTCLETDSDLANSTALSSLQPLNGLIQSQGTTQSQIPRNGMIHSQSYCRGDEKSNPTHFNSTEPLLTLIDPNETL